MENIIEKLILQIQDDQHNQRLDQVLASKLDFSRSAIQRLIKEEHILLNQEVTSANTKVKSGDVIEVNIPENKALSLTPTAMDLDIVYQDEHLLVINKPSGLVVHPGAGTKEPTLVEGLLAEVDDLSGINGTIRPGIVHRIDKDTSGLLVVAKSDQAHLGLSEQLANKLVERTYLAIVTGEVAQPEFVIDAPIGRDPHDRQKMTVTDKNAKPAITHGRVIEHLKDYTLVEFKLETGRTHQIRVHCKFIGHPILNDPVYANKKPIFQGGQLLHAYKLSFIHPITKQPMNFEVDLPEVFQLALKQLKKE